MLQGGNPNLRGRSAHRVLQRDLKGVAQIRAPLRALAPTTAAATKNIAKYIAKNVGEAAALKAATTH